MRINHNIAALNTYNKLSANNAATSKSLEKLSSGLKINRAGDDAAGLAISEKMRGQIRGLDQAGSNAQDGISLIQTAEGALNETHSILQRMRELSVQSSTDTNTTDDRTKIQSEMDELAKEITRISNTTEFNTQNLLAGGLNDTFHIGANAGQNITLSIGSMDAESLGVAGDLEVYQMDAANAAKITSVSNPSTNMNGYKISTGAKVAGTVFGDVTAAVVTKSNALGGVLTATAGAYNGSADATIMVKVDDVATDGANQQVTKASYSTDGGKSYTSVSVTAAAGAASTLSVAGLTLSITELPGTTKGDTYTFSAKAEYKTLQLNDGTSDIGSVAKIYNNATSAVIGNQDKNIGVKFDYTNLAAVAGTTTLTRNVTDSKSAEFGADGTLTSQAVSYKGLDVTTQANANVAITTIDNAIKTVSTERSKLGAYQNRLEHTINNLSTSSENLTAADSRVRDVDMAKEMMGFQKNNILSQAATSMLAQANQQPQNVLQLLK